MFAEESVTTRGSDTYRVYTIGVLDAEETVTEEKQELGCTYYTIETKYSELPPPAFAYVQFVTLWAVLGAPAPLAAEAFSDVYEKKRDALAVLPMCVLFSPHESATVEGRYDELVSTISHEDHNFDKLAFHNRTEEHVSEVLEILSECECAEELKEIRADTRDTCFKIMDHVKALVNKEH